MTLEGQGEDGVGPAREFIQIVGGQNSVFRTKSEEFKRLFGGDAFENVEILYYKLVLLSPTYS